MISPRAIDLFHECLRHPEPLIDKSYCSDLLIVSASRSHSPTPAVITWNRVLERITAAKVAVADEKLDEYRRHVGELDDLLLHCPYAQFLELTAFFPVFDVSFSMYRKLPDAQRLEFLSDILMEYIERRHDIYRSHGYSPNVVQVRKDFEKHKVQGNFAIAKAGGIFHSEAYTQASGDRRPVILESAKQYCFIDTREGQLALQEIRSRGDIWYDKWREDRQGKHADVLFVGRDRNYFICEMKHVKEGGGGQDKQIQELIQFIDKGGESDMDEGIGYVAFLDGVYFNKLIAPGVNTKAFKQKAHIEKCLASGRRDFFVNTHGFRKLLRNI